MLTKDLTMANTDSLATTCAGTGATTGGATGTTKSTGTICIKGTNPSITDITDHDEVLQLKITNILSHLSLVNEM